MFESINDLPAHVFFIHAPVVLVPLIALVSLVMAVRPRWRVTYAPLLAIASFIAFLCTLAARQSGQEFDKILAGQVDVSRHEQLGDQTTLLVFILLLLTIAAAVVSRRGPDSSAAAISSDDTAGASQALVPSTTTTAMSIAIVAVSALATVWMARTGDEGAKLVWDGVIGRPS